MSATPLIPAQSALFQEGNVRENKGSTRALLISSALVAIISVCGFFVSYGISGIHNATTQNFACAAVVGLGGLIMAKILGQLFHKAQMQCSREALYKECIKDIAEKSVDKPLAKRVESIILKEITGTKLLLGVTRLLLVAMAIITFAGAVHCHDVLHERWGWSCAASLIALPTSFILSAFISDKLSKRNASHLLREIELQTRTLKTDESAREQLLGNIMKIREGNKLPNLGHEANGHRLYEDIYRNKPIEDIRTFLSQHPITDKCRGEALCLATRRGNLELVNLLLQGSIPQKFFDAALESGLRNKNTPIAKSLLEKGPQFSPDVLGNAIIYFGISKFNNYNVEILKLILTKEVPPYILNETLARAIRDPGLANFLVENGAKIPSRFQSEAITFAALEGNLDFVKALVHHSADSISKEKLAILIQEISSKGNQEMANFLGTLSS